MASSKEYLEYVLDQLSGIGEVSYRPMMGEYVLYYRGKVFGGIYDDRFLIKPVKTAVEMIPDVEYEVPYDGGKEMILADADNREFLQELLPAIYDDLPAAKKRRKRS